MKRSSLLVNSVVFNSAVGAVHIDLSGEIKEVERKKYKNGELKEKYREILKLRIGNTNILDLQCCKHLSFRYVISQNRLCNSYTFDKKTGEEFIYVVGLENEHNSKKAKLYFAYSLFHEIGHSKLHRYQANTNFRDEKNAWAYSIIQVTKNFRELNKKEIPGLVESIAKNLGSYK